MADIVLLIIELVFFTLGVMTVLTTLKDWKLTRNRILIAISIYLVVVLGKSINDIVIYLFDLDIEIIVAGGLTIGLIIGFLLFAIQLEFLFYLKHLPKLYTLPFFCSFFLALGRVLVDSSMPFIIYAMIVSYGSAYYLIKDGRKSRNGLAIGMGLFFLIWGLGAQFQINIVLLSFKLVAMVALLLGTRGFYEKYVVVNIEEEQKVIETWIARLVVKE